MTREVRKDGWQWNWMKQICASGLPLALKLTALVLATFSDSRGHRARPSNATLAAATGKHPNRVSADKAELARRGWIRLKSEAHSQTPGVTDSYVLCVPDGSYIDRLIRRDAPVKRAAARTAELIPPAESWRDRLKAERAQIKGWLSGWLVRTLRRPELSAKARVAVVALALSGSGQGTHIYPGVKNLGYMTGMSDKTIRRALEELRNSGTVARLLDARSDHGCGLHDEYLLTETDERWLATAGGERATKKARQSFAGWSNAAARWPNWQIPAYWGPKSGPDHRSESYRSSGQNRIEAPVRIVDLSPPLISTVNLAASRDAGELTFAASDFEQAEARPHHPGSLFVGAWFEDPNDDPYDEGTNTMSIDPGAFADPFVGQPATEDQERTEEGQTDGEPDRGNVIDLATYLAAHRPA